MDLNEEDRKSLESFDTNLTGSELEEKFFNNLQQVMEKSKIKDTFIISGWSDKGLSDRGPKNRKMREFDYMIVSLNLKAIFQIEVKNSSNTKSIGKAIQQLEDGKKFFSSCVPFPQGENWRYIQGMYFENEVENEYGQPCSNCQNFVLTKRVDLSSWWKECVNKLPHDKEVCSSFPVNTYFNILKYLIFQMFLQDNCITKGLN